MSQTLTSQDALRLASVHPPRTHSALLGRPYAITFQAVQGFLPDPTPLERLTTDQKVGDSSSSGRAIKTCTEKGFVA